MVRRAFAKIKARPSTPGSRLMNEAAAAPRPSKAVIAWAFCYRLSTARKKRTCRSRCKLLNNWRDQLELRKESSGFCYVFVYSNSRKERIYPAQPSDWTWLPESGKHGHWIEVFSMP